MRYKVALASVAAGLMLASGAPAVAAESGERQQEIRELAAGIDRTQHQKYDARVAEQLRVAPGGVRIGDSVVYPDRGVAIDFAPQAAWACGADWLCLFNGNRGTGARARFRDHGVEQDLHRYGWGDRVNSWRNRSGSRAYLSQHRNDALPGWTNCLSAGSRETLPQGQRNEASEVEIGRVGRRYC